MSWYPRTYQSINTTDFVRSRTGFVQNLKGKARYHGTEPAYRSRVCSKDGVFPYNAEYLFDVHVGGAISGSTRDGLTNRCREKFLSEISDSAELGTALAEIGDSYSMIARRAISLRRAFNALRRFDLPRVAKELALPKDVQRNAERRVSKKHLASSNWLEYWLGWAPMVGDMQNAAAVISQEIPNRRIKVAVFDTGSRSYGFLSGNPPQPFYYGKAKAKMMVGHYATVRLVNPNLYLANQLGLLNPLSTALDVIPFSFIAGWFGNFSQMLGACTDGFGLEFTDSGNFFLLSGSGSLMHYGRESSEAAELSLMKVKFQGMQFERKPGGIPAPKLRIALPDRLSITRAATSVSLLAELFLKPR